MRRKGKNDAFEFLTSLVFGQLSARCLTLNGQAQGLSAPVARQSLHERYNAAAVTCFQSALVHCLNETLVWEPAQPMAAALRQQFAAVYLLDGTAFDVPASLAAAFPAGGGDGSPANVKVLLRYELLSGRLAAARAAFLLGPWPRSVGSGRAGADGVETAMARAKTLENSPLATVEWSAMKLGPGQIRCGPVRVAAFRRSAESAARQRAGRHEAARKQGRTPTAAARQLAGWLLLVTNAPPARYPARG